MRIGLLFCLVIIHAIVFAQPPLKQRPVDTLRFLNLFDKGRNAGVACYRIPAMVTAPNGNLIAAIDERVPSCGDLKWNRDINIVIRRSMDNGNTWLDIESVVNYPLGQSASDPSLIVDRVTNTIFLLFNFMDLDKEKDVYYLKVVRSTDNGKTWSVPADITTHLNKPEWRHDFKFITSGRGIQTTSGTLLHTLVNLEKGLFLFGSADHGKTWFLLNTAIKPADESQVVELAEGTWMINSRVNGAGLRYIHTSRDKGNTWHTQRDSSLPDPGCNASILRYTSVKEGSDKNRLLFSNAHAPKDRKNMTVKLSYDEGKTWAAQKTIYTGPAAYSSLSVLPNGDIALLFEKDDYSENVFVRFTLDWLTDGRDTYRNRKK